MGVVAVGALCLLMLYSADETGTVCECPPPPLPPPPSQPRVDQWAPGVIAISARSVDLSGVAVDRLPTRPSATKPAYRLPVGAEDIEGFQLLLSYRILRRPSSGPCLVVDVGCNYGMYTWYWAALGCDVFSVDVELNGGPSGIGAFSYETLALNPGLADRVTLFPVGIAAHSGALLTHGGGHNYKLVGSYALATGYTVRAATVAEVLGTRIDDVLLMKVDVDGGEIACLESMLDATRAGKWVRNVLVELTPMWWDRYGYSFDAAWQVLEQLLATHDVYVVYWREASQRCCRSTHGVPPDMDWDGTGLEFVQRLTKARLRDFLQQMARPGRAHGQRDFWFHDRTHPVDDRIADATCADVSLYATADEGPGACRRWH